MHRYLARASGFDIALFLIHVTPGGHTRPCRDCPECGQLQGSGFTLRYSNN